MKKHGYLIILLLILNVISLIDLSSAFTLNLNQPSINTLNLTRGINYYGHKPIIFNLTVSDSDASGFSSIIADIDKTLALWYPFTNAFGEDYAHIKDYSSYKSDAITNNFYTITTQGRQGSAIDFSRYDDVNLTGHDGFGSLVQTENTPQLDNLNQFTLSAWIKTNANLGASQYIISRWDTNMGSTQTGGFSLFLNNEGRPELNIYNKTTSFLAYSQTTITDGQWHHVVGTYDGNKMNIYLDGKLNASSTAYKGIVIPDKVPLTIGGLVNNTLGRFNGTIDDVQIYTRTLKTNEIESLYNSTKTPYYESIKLPEDNLTHTIKFYAQSSGGGIVMLPEILFENLNISNNDSCYNLNESHTNYNLTNDQYGINTCFKVTANDITLNCQNNKIQSNTTNTSLIQLSNVNNFTIKNCNLQINPLIYNFGSTIIQLEEVKGLTIINSTLRSLPQINSLGTIFRIKNLSELEINNSFLYSAHGGADFYSTLGIIDGLNKATIKNSILAASGELIIIGNSNDLIFENNNFYSEFYVSTNNPNNMPSHTMFFTNTNNANYTFEKNRFYGETMSDLPENTKILSNYFDLSYSNMFYSGLRYGILNYNSKGIYASGNTYNCTGTGGYLIPGVCVEVSEDNIILNNETYNTKNSRNFDTLAITNGNNITIKNAKFTNNLALNFSDPTDIGIFGGNFTIYNTKTQNMAIHFLDYPSFGWLWKMVDTSYNMLNWMPKDGVFEPNGKFIPGINGELKQYGTINLEIKNSTNNTIIPYKIEIINSSNNTIINGENTKNLLLPISYNNGTNIESYTSQIYKINVYAQGYHNKTLQINYTGIFQQNITIVLDNLPIINHAPIINSINIQGLTARDLIKIIVNASDQDNDTITITYSNPFNASGEWQSNNNSEGNYTTNISVSDGKTTVEKSINFTINPYQNNTPPQTDNSQGSSGGSGGNSNRRTTITLIDKEPTRTPNINYQNEEKENTKISNINKQKYNNSNLYTFLGLTLGIILEIIIITILFTKKH